MTAQFIAMEKTIEASELLEMVVETEAGAGARGLSVAGGGKEGLFVKDVLKDSPAARMLSLQEGDQLLSARVYFDNIKYEDALQILKCAEPYKISFCLKRVVPSTDVSRKPGATVFEVRGPKAKMAKLNIQALSSLKRKKKKERRRRRMVAQSLQEMEARLSAGKPEGPPVDVEFSFPKFSKLRKARSAGEVAVAEASPGLSRKLSSLETKRHRLKFPRLKVKEAVADEARLAMGRPRALPEPKEASRGEGEGKTFRFTLPFSKAKKPKEEAGAKVEMGFQAPQVEFALPRMGAGEEPREASPKGQRLALAAPPLGWPQVEAVLPKGSAGVLESQPALLQAGLKLPAAEVAAPKVDVDLALPRLEGAAPEAAPKREGGFRIKVPKFGVSAEEAELKVPLMKAPALELALGESPQRGWEEQPRAGGAVPSLGMAAPGVDLELPFPKGKAGTESPEIPGRASLARVPQLGSKAQGGGAGKLAQVELSLGAPGGSRANEAKGSIIQLPGLEISLREQPLESREAAGVAGATRVKLPEVRVPSLDISAPKVQEMHLCKVVGEPAAPSGRAKPKEAAEGAGGKFQMPQISLPKLDFPAKEAPSRPPVQVKMLKPEGDAGMKVGLPKVDVSLLAIKVPGLQLPKVPKPELGISVERPEVEMTAPPAPLSFPSATVPALDIQLPKVGVGLDLAQCERDVSEQGPEAQKATLETLSKDLEVEIGLPKCLVSQPGLEPGMGSIKGPALAGMAAKFPKLDLAFEKRPEETEGPEGVKMKLPSVEIPPIGFPEKTAESQVKAKTSRFALSKFSISGPKVWSKMSPEISASGVEGREAADLGSKLKLPKFGISLPKSKWEAEAEDAKLAREVGGEAPKERLGQRTGSRMGLPLVEVVDIGCPQGTEGWAGGDREGTSPELLGVQFKEPKLSLLSFGGKGEEEERGALESEEVKLQGRKGGLRGQPEPRMLEKEAKASKFRIASLGLMGREGEAKAKKAPGSPKEKPKGPFGKMPQLKLSSLKAQGERRKAHLLAPELDEKALPQVELPKLAGLIPGPESPGFRVQVPSVEIAGPSSKAEVGASVAKRAGDAAKAERQQQEGELKRPRAPPIQVSAPTLELDIALPMACKEEGVLQAAAGAKVRLPKVELAKLGKGEEEEEAEAAMQLLGKGGEKDLDGVAEASALGTKVRLPKVDISLAKAWLPEAEDLGLEGPEAKVKMPSMGLSKLSAPKMKAPELELDMGLDGGGVVPKVTVGPPSVKWPTFGGLGSAGDGQGEEDLPRVPQLELKPPKLRGSADALDSETGAKESWLKVPALPLGLGKLETEAGMGTEGSRFRLKLPSLSVSKPEAELSLDAQPLCPPAEEAAPAFRIALLDVSFSGDQERREKAKSAGATEVGLEGMLKMPKIGIAACEAEGTKGGIESATSPGQRAVGGGEPEGKKSVFKVPGLEISAPSLKPQAEYEVGGPHMWQRGSLDLEGADREGWKRTDGHSDSGKWHRVKIPTLGLFLPRAGLGAPGGLVEQEAEAKGGLLALGWPKEKEGSAGLLGREEGCQDKAVKLKLRSPFGVSLSRPKGNAEVNGEAEKASPRLKGPRQGFSKAEDTAQLQGERVEVLLQDGTSKLGKLPQVELLSPSKGAENDPELSVQLVKAEEAKAEAPHGTTAATALKAAKFKPPRITLSGFKKRNGGVAPEAVAAAVPQAGGASLKTTFKGDPSSKFRFPKVALSSRSQEVLEISEHQQDQGRPGGNFRLPAVAFSAESGPQEGEPPPRKPLEKEAL
ncbi:periaxin [Thamnophis elegans]|uniref:periaxin n=1 Tax=Thamnophis elegans TaxID=35005 RepID=UPI001376A13E|nr:periaxin [Thamnophis elegans]